MADDGLHGRASTQVALDGVGDAAFLAGDVDLHLAVGRRVVAAVAAVSDNAREAPASAEAKSCGRAGPRRPRTSLQGL